mgnify:CR=1 FL=1
MEVKLVRADPAGNITLLVTSPVAPARRAAAARALLSIPELGGEQVGYLTAPELGGTARLEMMGGEFCGNALRSAGFLVARQRGSQGRTSLVMECSGCPEPLQVAADLDLGEATAQLPLPKTVTQARLCGLDLGVVVFDGIVHGILEGKPLARDLAARATRELADRYQADAAGLMFLRYDGGWRMDPAVYVAATDTLFFESSCASGSGAAACYLSEEASDGVYPYAIRQPGGTIRAGVIRQDGAPEMLTVGGAVALGEERTVELEL